MSKKTNDVKQYEPPVEVRRFVQALLSEKVLGNKDMAERVTGVNKSKFYYAYRSNPDFRAWYSEQCDHFLGDKEHLASMALMKKVLKGNVLAIRTFFEMLRKLKVAGINIDNSVKVLPNVQIVFTTDKVGERGVEISNTDQDTHTEESIKGNRISEQV